MFLIDKLLAYGDNASYGDEEGKWYEDIEELRDRIISRDIVIVNFRYEDNEYEIANIFDGDKFFDIEQDEDEFIESRYGYPVYRFVDDKNEKQYYKAFEELLSDVKIDSKSFEGIFDEIVFY